MVSKSVTCYRPNVVFVAEYSTFQVQFRDYLAIIIS